VLSSIPVIAFDLDVARVHARLDAALSSAGKAVGDTDLMIAATAICLDYRIATRICAAFPESKGSTSCAGSRGIAVERRLQSLRPNATSS
jgi:hypothetical protein